MSDYWTGLLNYKQKEKQHRYFRAEVDEDGEVCGDICEINFIEERDRIKEQLQEDLIAWASCDPLGEEPEQDRDDLCQIVVNNFEEFE
jgi:hypothetical protein